MFKLQSKALLFYENPVTIYITGYGYRCVCAAADRRFSRLFKKRWASFRIEFLRFPEFGGHGPEIWAWINLKIVDKKYIDAEVYMHARETTSDWSETEGTWTKRIYTAPTGAEITAIVSGKHSEVHYISRPGVSSFTPLGLATAIGGQKGIDVPFKDDGLVSGI